MPHMTGTARQVSHTAGTGVQTSGTNDAIWTIWIGDSASATTSATGAGTGSAIWTAWNTVYESATTGNLSSIQVIGGGTIANQTTVTNGEIWTAWSHTYSTTSNTVVVAGSIPGRALSAEERRALETQRAAENARWEEQRRANAAEEAKAQERAEKLLQQSLDAKQQSDLKANGYFELDVISKNGDRRRYRIHRKWSHSIQQVDPANGKRLKTLCIHPGVQVPVADSMLAQKLMLESGMEEELLRIANHS